MDVQEFGKTATYSCSDADALWHYPNGTLIATDPSLDLYQFVRQSRDIITLVFAGFSASLQGYYTCSIANPAMSATLGVFVTSNLCE